MPVREALLALCAVAITAMLVVASSVDTAGAVIAVVASALLAMILVLGPTRSAVVLLVAGFATAPMFRGLEAALSDFATLTDLLMAAGALLLVPEALRRRSAVPAVYLIALPAITVLGLTSSVFSGALFTNLFFLGQWLFYLGLLPLLVAWWRPDGRTVAWLMWAYLAGHMASSLTAFAEGPIGNGRYDGLTHHPNAFGLASLVSVAIVLHLLSRHRSLGPKVLLLLIGAVAIASATISGSRSAALVIAVLILLVPIVERSAPMGFVFALLGALFVAALPTLVGASGEGTAISRLAGGDQTAEGADASRSDALSAGWERFLGSPIFGSGFVDVELYHNVFLEVAVAIGILGVLLYAAVIAALARPLFSRHEQRRLGYLVVAFIGTAPAFPGIWDRTIWVPMCLTILTIVSPRAPSPAPGAVAVRERQ